MGQKRNNESLKTASEVEWRGETWEIIINKEKDMVIYWGGAGVWKVRDREEERMTHRNLG